MDDKELKTKLARLWKATFHDSDEYVALVFDNLFDPQLCETEIAGGEVVAGIIGIPYGFGNAETSLRGLYLCGIATDTKFRSQGIMTRLLERINRKASELGFSFTFLIPADGGLRKYYRDRGYVNAFYRIVDNYTSLHDFNLEYDSLLDERKDKVSTLKKRYFDSLITVAATSANPFGEDDRNGLRELITGMEGSQNDLQILHTPQNIDLLLRENAISGGAVYIAKTPGGTVTAAAFTSVDQTDSAVKLLKLYSSDESSKYKVLQRIKEDWPNLSIAHYVPSIDMDREALWTRTYGSAMASSPNAPSISGTESVYSLAAHSKVYGMVRVLDLIEILKIQANQRKDIKYSILMKGEDSEKFIRIEARNGEVSTRVIDKKSLAPSQTAYVMSERDVCEILFRRRDTDNMITEAFGIPSVNAAISLMLD